MTSRNIHLPYFAGSSGKRTPTQLAESAIENISLHRRYGKHKKPLVYGVGMDLAGRIVVDHLHNLPQSEWLMTCTYKTDPDELAELIRDEIEERAQ
jgi:hypothetical protein